MLRRESLKHLAGVSLLLLSGLLKPVTVLAKWKLAAFSAEELDSAINNYFPGESITETKDIRIGVRSEIENGAVVPVKIETDLKQVDSISIFVEKNPNPLIANFDLSPSCKAFVSTRIKVDQPSNIIVIIRSEGALFSNQTFITVHKGGCG